MSGGSPASPDGLTSERVRDPRPSTESVAAVIVTYHPDAALADRVRPLIGQVGTILVVDNGSREMELAPLAVLVRDSLVDAIWNGRNLGVATALNQGLSWVADRGFAWALTLDQDTTPGPDLVAEAARVFDELSSPAPAVIGATSVTDAVVDPGGAVTCVVTSGALHSVRAWATLGRFREDFFIDQVDIEFCLRARSKGYAILAARRPTVQHTIGHPTRHRTVLRSFTVTNHDRVRRYYMTRNRIHVWRRYWRRETGYVTEDMRRAAKELVKLVLFETDRAGKVHATLRGGIDGLRGLTGELRVARHR